MFNVLVKEHLHRSRLRRFPTELVKVSLAMFGEETSS